MTDFFTDKLKIKGVKVLGLIHKIYLSQRKNAHDHTASTKTKSEVRGGGRKPWRQKGTGNARAGSIRSPLWVGGGVTFGPKPHLTSKKVNIKERRLAILSALYLKKNSMVMIDEQFLQDFSKIKTKKIIRLLASLGIQEGEKILFISTYPNPKIWKSCRNIPCLDITAANSISLEQILKSTHILITQAGLDVLSLTYFF